MATEIYNPSVEIATLPYPLTGALKGGQRIVLSQSVSTLTSASPSLSGPFRVRDIGSYTGSVDDASYGLASGQSVAQTITVNDATTNDVSAAMTLSHTTSGTAANNIGAGLVLKAENDAGTAKRAGMVAGVLSSVADGAEVGKLVFYPAVADTPVAGMEVQGVASAVNGLTVLSAAASGNVRMYPNGETNVSLRIAGKGTGSVSLANPGNTVKVVEVNATGLGFFGTAPVAQGAALSDIGAFTDPPSAIEMAALRTAVNGILARLRTPGLIAT